jgi:hypothetical protein
MHDPRGAYWGGGGALDNTSSYSSAVSCSGKRPAEGRGVGSSFCRSRLDTATTHRRARSAPRHPPSLPPPHEPVNISGPLRIFTEVDTATHRSPDGPHGRISGRWVAPVPQQVLPSVRRWCGSRSSRTHYPRARIVPGRAVPTRRRESSAAVPDPGGVSDKDCEALPGRGRNCERGRGTRSAPTWPSPCRTQVGAPLLADRTC